MLLLVTTKADDKILRRAAEDLDGYVKVVVDVEKKVYSFPLVKWERVFKNSSMGCFGSQSPDKPIYFMVRYLNVV